MIIEKLYQLLNRVIVYIVKRLVRFSCGRRIYEISSTMPQKLHVLRCYSCKMFQVQIVKKVPKWQCRMCNEKQMTQVVYFQGSGAECRKYVQTQNLKNIEGKELAVIDAWGFDCEVDEHSQDSCDCSERKLMAEKLTSFLTSDEHELKENSELLQSSKRQKLNSGSKLTMSLPDTDLCSSNKWQRKSRTFPITKNKFDRPNKYNKFLEPQRVHEVNEEKFEGNYSPKEKSPNFSDTEHQNSPIKDPSGSNSLSNSISPKNSLESRANDLQNNAEPMDQKIETCEGLISSQVDESSNSSRSPFQGIVANLFEDLDHDSDFELDF
ncbi:uncharacterized protein [Venturia canescens]|uniref:uncharacterized protein n=1 Tax=Venturia canescens TaxID=32260 RepID=UPI001C9C7697|nr:uncharacterized protein LOC122418383 [Venturia canescens]